MWPFFQSIWFWQEGFIQEELIMQKGSSISWGSLGATDFEFFGASESPRPLGMSNWQHHPGMIAGIAWLYRQNHCGSSQFLFLQPPVVDERNLCIYIYISLPLKNMGNLTEHHRSLDGFSPVKSSMRHGNRVGNNTTSLQQTADSADGNLQTSGWINHIGMFNGFT